MLLTVAVALPLHPLPFALLLNVQPKKVARKTKGEGRHHIDQSVGQQRLNKVYHSPN